MAIDYVVSLPCEPKRRLGCDALQRRLRQLDRLEEGEQGTDATRDAREAAFELRPLAFHCVRCPANHLRREFGCFGRIATPLPARAEEWLMELLPAALKTRAKASREVRPQVAAVRALAQRLRELGVEGRSFDEQFRQAGLMEGSQAVVRSYGWLFNRVRLTSSQLLELLLGRGQVVPEDAETVCQALGAWVDGETGPDGVPEAVFTQPPDGNDPAAVIELKELLYALMVACSLDVAVASSIDAETADVPT